MGISEVRWWPGSRDFPGVRPISSKEALWIQHLAGVCTALKCEPLLRPSSALLPPRTPRF